MCDYSLEMYQSRPAREVEEYISSRFPISSIGFISPGNPSVAICMACDTKLKLARLPEGIQTMANAGETEEVTFIQVEGPTHRDCVRFKNGKIFTLQLLGPGVTAWLVPEPRLAPSAPVRETSETALT